MCVNRPEGFADCTNHFSNFMPFRFGELAQESEKTRSRSALKGVLDVAGESPARSGFAVFFRFLMEIGRNAAPFLRRKAVFLFHVIRRGDLNRSQSDNLPVVND